MRVGAHHPVGVGELYARQHGACPLGRITSARAIVIHRYFDELLAEGHRGIERCHRLLVDHGDRRAPNPAQLFRAHGEYVAPLEEDLPPHHATGRTEVAHDGQRDRGLATA